MEDYNVTGWPGELLPHFEYFVPFFFVVVIFYVISPTIAQILMDPGRKEEDNSCLTEAHVYMRLKTRPIQGTVTEADHVHSYSILLWPQDVAEILIFLQVTFARLIAFNQIMLAT